MSLTLAHAQEPVVSELSQKVFAQYSKLAKEGKLSKDTTPILEDGKGLVDQGCYSLKESASVGKELQSEFVKAPKHYKSWAKRAATGAYNVCVVFTSEDEDGSGAGVYYGILIPSQGKVEFKNKDIVGIGFED